MIRNGERTEGDEDQDKCEGRVTDPTSATTLPDVRAIMATPIDENPASVYSDEIVHTLGEFPELTKAVRDGDLAMVSILCAQLFDLDASRRTRLKARTTPKLNDVNPQ